MNMNINRRFLKASPYVALCLGWNYIDNFDTDAYKKKAFNKGLELSQKFKKYPSWDKYAEPLIVRQFGFIFSIGNSFIKGLISDNKEGSEAIEETIKDIKDELDVDLQINNKDCIVKKHD